MTESTDALCRAHKVSGVSLVIYSMLASLCLLTDVEHKSSEPLQTAYMVAQQSSMVISILTSD